MTTPIFNINYDEVTDLVLAADGIRAVLAAREGRVALVGDDLVPAVTRFIPQAAEWVALRSGVVEVTEFADDAVTMRVVIPTLAWRRKIMVAALAWRVMHLIFLGADSFRADRCLALAADAIDSLVEAAAAAGCPVRRRLCWL